MRYAMSLVVAFSLAVANVSLAADGAAIFKQHCASCHGETGKADTAAINAKIREIANPPGKAVATFSEGKAALKAGKINYEGASSALDFDEYGDVTPDFSMSAIEKGKLVRKYIVKI